MKIRDDFKAYTDGNNLLAPNPVPPGTKQGSDNGPMFTSEYFIILKRYDSLTVADELEYDARIGQCLNSEGMLCRAPGDLDQEGPDDYYGVMNGCIEMENTAIPRKVLWALIKHLGFLNNNQPGKWTGEAFLVRQPQLVCAMISAAFPSLWNPIHWLVRLLALPLYLWSALVLFVSCMNTPSSDTDARRLAWHLGNCVSKVSILNAFAYKVWLHRLYSVFPDGMQGVAKIYYQPQGKNPYSDWWTT